MTATTLLVLVADCVMVRVEGCVVCEGHKVIYAGRGEEKEDTPPHILWHRFGEPSYRL